MKHDLRHCGDPACCVGTIIGTCRRCGLGPVNATDDDCTTKIGETFGSAIAIFGSDNPPRGIDFIATSLAAPGLFVDPGCPIHGVGCPSQCPFLRAYRAALAATPRRCREP